MTTRLWPLLKAGAVLLAVLLALLAFLPEHRDVAVQVYTLVLGAIVLLGLLGVLRAATPTRPSSFDKATRPRALRVERLTELARVERDVMLAGASTFDVHYRLRPRVRAVAAHRLATRYGIDLDGDPDAARAALDPAVWELVRPDREPPHDRFGPGIGREQLRTVIDGLDTI